jgi:tetratricopeptide (TPR) repeat protein/Tol biopolymer transport system component
MLSPRRDGAKESTLNRTGVTLLILSAAVAAVCMLGQRLAAQPKSGQGTWASHPASITIDYPLDGSIFPPEITPPTFIWRDATVNATRWGIDIAFADGSAEMHIQSAGERLVIGEIDQRCVSSTNELPKLTPELSAAHTWIPEAGDWEAIKRHSVTAAAVITISGFSQRETKHAVSSGRVTIRTSKDPVGAPIFYRDVPLMPSETEKGIIKPLAPTAIPLIQWRLRNIGELESRVVLKDMPTCANCHSFSLDGKTMGMDMDGPANDKGLYAIVPVKPQMTINTADMISWNPSQDPQVSLNRVGFMSQVSPDGKYVLTTVNMAERLTETNYYVVNFKDYRFLQVFYPTRGILAWYSRDTGRREPLPGADDTRYVQTDGVWSPDGSYLVFARAGAKEPYPRDRKMAAYANDPAEVQIQYDLYRVPFNGGHGGQAEAIAGASGNGMSNTFPKVSPDGRWIVFVKCRNAQLMRPDSQLYIVPARGGQARRMRCNTPLMNSWHSFSPNGRWLVFSSKAQSPYTQMYLTHLDEEGNDSPAILIDNSTAANRAVNLPEFVNIPPDGIVAINTPAVDMYKKFNHAAELGEKGEYDAAIVEWRELLATNPDDARIHSNLGIALAHKGRDAEAISEFEKTLEVNPQAHGIYNNLGRSLLAAGRPDEAIRILEKGLQYYPESADMHDHLGLALASKGRIEEAKAEFDKAMEIHPDDVIAHFARGIALAYKGDWDAAITEYKEALRLNPQSDLMHVYLGAALKQKGDVDAAIEEYRVALKLNPNKDDVHATLGAALWSKRDWDGEIREEREALRLNPKNKLAHALLGMALGHKGDWDGDVAEQREALLLDPNNELVHLNLGGALGHRGDWSGAIAQYREALHLNPKNEEAHALLGAALGNKHDWDGEIAEEREALRLNPKNSEAHYALGFALESKGNRGEALREYRAAYQLNPDGDGYRQAYERLLQPTSRR